MMVMVTENYLKRQDSAAIQDYFDTLQNAIAVNQPNAQPPANFSTQGYRGQAGKQNVTRVLVVMF